MSEKVREPIAIKTGMDRDCFYIGYSRFPGNKALAKSVFNAKLYAPHPVKPYSNQDGSVTLRFSRFNLGFDPQERYRNFSDFVAEQVVTQLMEATGVDVAAPDEVSVVELYAANMSLFASGLVDPETVEQMTSRNEK